MKTKEEIIKHELEGIIDRLRKVGWQFNASNSMSVKFIDIISDGLYVAYELGQKEEIEKQEELRKRSIIKKKKRSIEEKLEIAKQNLDNTAKQVRAELVALSKECSHPNECVNYYPDAAGGSDSCHICSICGKEW